MNGQGGDLLIDLIRKQGGRKTFRKDINKDTNRALLHGLECLADDGYLEACLETPDEVVYTLSKDLPA